MIIAVGSNAAKAGKTSLICSILHALPEARWQALKISAHGHHLPPGPAYRLDEQLSADSTDTGRFLEAGAIRSWWLRVAEGRFPEAGPAIEEIRRGSSNLLIESNSVIDVLAPQLAVMVIHANRPAWKESAIPFLRMADILVCIEKPYGYHGPKTKAVFPVLPPGYSLEPFLHHLRGRL